MPENFCGFVFRRLLLPCFSRLHSQISRSFFCCNWRWFSHEKWRHETNLIAIQRIFDLLRNHCRQNPLPCQPVQGCRLDLLFTIFSSAKSVAHFAPSINLPRPTYPTFELFSCFHQHRFRVIDRRCSWWFLSVLPRLPPNMISIFIAESRELLADDRCQGWQKVSSTKNFQKFDNFYVCFLTFRELQNFCINIIFPTLAKTWNFWILVSL